MRSDGGRFTPDGQRLVTRRAAILGGLQAATLLVIGARLYELQISDSRIYRELAEENRINIRLLAPERGLIFDRNGVVVALNKPTYSIVMVREEAEDVEEALGKLALIVPMSGEEIRRKREEIRSRREFVPVAVADDVTWEQVAAVSANSPSMPGVTVEYGSTRIYPFGRDFAHVVGYVGKVSPEEMSDRNDQDPLLGLPQLRIGKIGVERALDRDLRGRAGNETIEVNVHGRVVRDLARTEPTQGADIQLTIDAWLQNYLIARLGPNPASAVLFDLESASVLAIASTPTFDPNDFAAGISQAGFERLLSNPHRPLINRPAQGIYPPGSVFKAVTALAALQEGLITPADTFKCNGKFEAATRTYHCWRKDGHGSVDLSKSIAESCDVFYYNLGRLVGIEKISEMARRLGIGVRPNLPIPDAAEGLAPTGEWKLRNRDAKWVAGDTLNAAIGQGFVLASALQIAIMTARLATGTMFEPRLVMSPGSAIPEAPSFPPLGIPDEHVEAVRNGMFTAVNGIRGTAFESRSIDASFPIAGKTGTSQIQTITLDEREAGVVPNEERPWNRRDHALFCGYGPFEQPKFAVAVIMEHGGNGSAIAAPIARDILLRAHYGRMPPLAAYPKEFRGRVLREQQALDLRPRARPRPGNTRA